MRVLVETMGVSDPMLQSARDALCADTLADGTTVVLAEDWAALETLNREHAESWFPLLPRPAGAPTFWLAAVDHEGEPVAVQAAALLDCSTASLGERLEDLTAFHDPGGAPSDDWCFVASATARETHGPVALITSGWTRPDWRGRGLFHRLGRLVRLVVLERWAVRWVAGLVDPETVPQWSAAKAGHRHLDPHPTILLHQTGAGRLPLHLLRFTTASVRLDLSAHARRSLVTAG
ncbi:hypothetical protein M2352_000333 [Azospirillum fermentarium]|uniref:hypothetical protein n=1 Tax=Azospirillum fermentarium TaxID=1233114 RepID=UPI002226F2BF|nr:hypothetical protein [Azospirillum fermentarium]MCW2244742.1 hypothetical protein [Azospirillum fermentarium]